MERMEVDQCAGAAGGGGALRRSNSAPMITSVSDGMTVFSSNSSARYRRSSVSVNPTCPSRTPLSPFSLSSERSDHRRLMDNMEHTLRGSLQRLSASSSVPLPSASHWHEHLSQGFHSQDSGVTPNSSPSPTRRFRGGSVSPAVRWPVVAPLKRKGGAESDGPPKKLFVAGVTGPAHITSCTVSVHQSVDSSSGAVPVCPSPQNSQLTLSPPPNFTAHHPSI
ncbi:P2R1A-PPP2R2A-interacting phosphatase regulator 1 [Hoplias malabaricus]|uniref:P2R1A-PPP2R2A-interacting phosphatase regulator 1 n=1 Tax=Hoplias malabaricus TaxID=27720 RepID=UPI0034633D70